MGIAMARIWLLGRSSQDDNSEHERKIFAMETYPLAPWEGSGEGELRVERICGLVVC